MTVSSSTGTVSDPGALTEQAETGRLTIRTDPSPLAIRVLDEKWSLVAQGASPLTIEVPTGLYVVQASQPGRRDLTTIAHVDRKANRSIQLPSADPNVVPFAKGLMRKLVEEYVHKFAPVSKVTSSYTAEESPLEAKPFWIRFFHLKDWHKVESLPPLAFASEYIGGRAVLNLTNTHHWVVFAQVMGASGSPINVSLPPASARDVQCQLVVSVTADRLAARVRLATDWANSALQYMAQGYIDQAKEIIKANKVRFEEKPSIFFRALRHVAHRLDDPSGMLIPRYLGLRTGEDTSLSIFGESLIDLLQQNLSDGFVISAETYARKREFKRAAQEILTIRPGRIPLFTEGFSLLIHRVAELLDLDLELLEEDRRPETEQIARLKDLKRTLNKWAPYVDLNSPTVTFFGNDVTAPSTTGTPVVPTVDDGWIQGPTPPT